MIAAHWQDIVAGLAVLAALVYYVRRRLRAPGAACDGCPSGGCATDVEAPDRGSTLIAIEDFGHGPAEAKADRAPR